MLAVRQTKKHMVSKSQAELSPGEYCCALWATAALPFDLIENPMFRAQFGPCIPVGLGRQELSSEMKILALKINELALKKIGKGVVTIGIDGWTNCRHHKMLNVTLIHNGEAHFLNSVEVQQTPPTLLVPLPPLLRCHTTVVN